MCIGRPNKVYPPVTLLDKVKDTILDYTVRLGLSIGIIGLFNVQYIVDDDDVVYIIEVNPSLIKDSTVPFKKR